jgi:hypothetical protein
VQNGLLESLQQNPKLKAYSFEHEQAKAVFTKPLIA